IVVAVVALPALYNPRSADAFGVTKAVLLQVVGLLAGACGALAVWSDRRRLRVNALLIAGSAVVAAFCAAALLGVAPVLSFFAPSGRHEGTFTLLALAAVAFAASILDDQGIDAVLSAIAIGSVGPCLYAIAAEAHESAWTVFAGRAGGTFGNPILLGDY